MTKNLVQAVDLEFTGVFCGLSSCFLMNREPFSTFETAPGGRLPTWIARRLSRRPSMLARRHYAGAGFLKGCR